MKKARYKKGYRSKFDPHKINNKITSQEVRLVGDNIEQGVYSTGEALQMAREQELDLVEISPNAKPPVCKIMDYRRFLYEQKKKKKELKATQTKMLVKEIRFGPNTDDHDVEFKRKHAEKFLMEGSKVRAYVFFKGRTIVHKERGELLLLQFVEKLSHISKLEQLPKMEGKKMIIMLAPDKEKVDKYKRELDKAAARAQTGNKPPVNDKAPVKDQEEMIEEVPENNVTNNDTEE